MSARTVWVTVKNEAEYNREHDRIFKALDEVGERLRRADSKEDSARYFALQDEMADLNNQYLSGFVTPAAPAPPRPIAVLLTTTADYDREAGRVHAELERVGGELRRVGSDERLSAQYMALQAELDDYVRQYLAGLTPAAAAASVVTPAPLPKTTLRGELASIRERTAATPASTGGATSTPPPAATSGVQSKELKKRQKRRQEREQREADATAREQEQRDRDADAKVERERLEAEAQRIATLAAAERERSQQLIRESQQAVEESQRLSSELEQRSGGLAAEQQAAAAAAAQLKREQDDQRVRELEQQRRDEEERERIASQEPTPSQTPSGASEPRPSSDQTTPVFIQILTPEALAAAKRLPNYQDLFDEMHVPFHVITKLPDETNSRRPWLYFVNHKSVGMLESNDIDQSALAVVTRAAGGPSNVVILAIHSSKQAAPDEENLSTGQPVVSITYEPAGLVLYGRWATAQNVDDYKRVRTLLGLPEPAPGLTTRVASAISAPFSAAATTVLKPILGGGGSEQPAGLESGMVEEPEVTGPPPDTTPLVFQMGTERDVERVGTLPEMADLFRRLDLSYHMARYDGSEPRTERRWLYVVVNFDLENFEKSDLDAGNLARITGLAGGADRVVVLAAHLPTTISAPARLPTGQPLVDVSYQLRTRWVDETNDTAYQRLKALLLGLPDPGPGLAARLGSAVSNAVFGAASLVVAPPPLPPAAVQQPPATSQPEPAIEGPVVPSSAMSAASGLGALSDLSAWLAQGAANALANDLYEAASIGSSAVGAAKAIYNEFVVRAERALQANDSHAAEETLAEIDSRVLSAELQPIDVLGAGMRDLVLEDFVGLAPPIRVPLGVRGGGDWAWFAAFNMSDAGLEASARAIVYAMQGLCILKHGPGQTRFGYYEDPRTNEAFILIDASLDSVTKFLETLVDSFFGRAQAAADRLYRGIATDPKLHAEFEDELGAQWTKTFIYWYVLLIDAIQLYQWSADDDALRVEMGIQLRRFTTFIFVKALLGSEASSSDPNRLQDWKAPIWRVMPAGINDWRDNKDNPRNTLFAPPIFPPIVSAIISSTTGLPAPERLKKIQEAMMNEVFCALGEDLVVEPMVMQRIPNARCRRRDRALDADKQKRTLDIFFSELGAKNLTANPAVEPAVNQPTAKGTVDYLVREFYHTVDAGMLPEQAPVLNPTNTKFDEHLIPRADKNGIVSPDETSRVTTLLMAYVVRDLIEEAAAICSYNITRDERGNALMAVCSAFYVPFKITSTQKKPISLLQQFGGRPRTADGMSTIRSAANPRELANRVQNVFRSALSTSIRSTAALYNTQSFVKMAAGTGPKDLQSLFYKLDHPARGDVYTVLVPDNEAFATLERTAGPANLERALLRHVIVSTEPIDVHKTRTNIPKTYTTLVEPSTDPNHTIKFAVLVGGEEDRPSYTLSIYEGDTVVQQIDIKNTAKRGKTGRYWVVKQPLRFTPTEAPVTELLTTALPPPPVNEPAASLLPPPPAALPPPLVAAPSPPRQRVAAEYGTIPTPPGETYSALPGGVETAGGRQPVVQAGAPADEPPADDTVEAGAWPFSKRATGGALANETYKLLRKTGALADVQHAINDAPLTKSTKGVEIADLVFFLPTGNASKLLPSGPTARHAIMTHLVPQSMLLAAVNSRSALTPLRALNNEVLYYSEGDPTATGLSSSTIYHNDLEAAHSDVVLTGTHGRKLRVIEIHRVLVGGAPPPAAVVGVVQQPAAPTQHPTPTTSHPSPTQHHQQLPAPVQRQLPMPPPQTAPVQQTTLHPTAHMKKATHDNARAFDAIFDAHEQGVLSAYESQHPGAMIQIFLPSANTFAQGYTEMPVLGGSLTASINARTTAVLHHAALFEEVQNALDQLRANPSMHSVTVNTVAGGPVTIYNGKKPARGHGDRTALYAEAIDPRHSKLLAMSNGTFYVINDIDHVLQLPGATTTQTGARASPAETNLLDVLRTSANEADWLAALTAAGDVGPIERLRRRHALARNSAADPAAKKRFAKTHLGSKH